MPTQAPETVAPLVARTLSMPDGTFVELIGWTAKEPSWLVIYDTTATDGIVWVSTVATQGSVNSADGTPDRRPLRPPCQFYLGPYRRVSVGTTSGEASKTVTLEITPHPVQPIRMSPADDASRCER